MHLAETTMLFIQAHPWLYYVLIIAIFAIIGVVIVTTPKKSTTAKNISSVKNISHIATSKDISAIAGDDLFATQLDLAKAYIEMDQHDLARKILKETLKSGTPAQQIEAHQLIAALT